MSPSHALAFDPDPYSVTSFVDRTHKECSNLQWLRELVMNSIEGILATGLQGEIFIHSISQDMGEGINKVRKLAITDTGEGIAEDELYSSFKVGLTTRGRDGNYGVGAKISSIPLNPAGMIYRSLVDGGVLRELIWHRTSQYGYYEASAVEDPTTGEFRVVTPPTPHDSAYDDCITKAGHGTQVVLCGENPEDDTCATLGPQGRKSAGNLHWAIRALNFKLWRIPEGIEIRVENAKVGDRDPEVKDYIVHGGAKGLADFALDQGTVDLRDNPYKVRWFLLKEGSSKRNSQNDWAKGRIVGTLYQEPSTGVVEVYAMRNLRHGAALMNDFGIYTGAERVVLLVEPKHLETMQPTTSRDDLRIVGEGLSISDVYKAIGQEFLGLMSDKARPLASYVRSQLDGLKSTSDEEKLKEVIRRAIELYRIKDFRRLAKGNVTSTSDSDEESSTAAVVPTETHDDPVVEDVQQPEESSPNPQPRRPPIKQRPRPRPMFDEAGDRRDSEVPPDIAPKTFRWTSLEDPHQVTTYSAYKQPEVVINSTGNTYLRLLALYRSRPDFADHPDVVEEVLKGKCEALLQLSIFTLEHEFKTQSKGRGSDFEDFTGSRNNASGSDEIQRICLDAMALKEVHDSTVREIRNMISKAKSKAAAEARTTDNEAA